MFGTASLMKTLWMGALGAVTAMTAATGLGACAGEDENACSTWVERLKTGGGIERSLERIAFLKCTDALPTMKALFDKGNLQDRILQTVKLLDHREGAAVEIVRAALKTNKLANMAGGIVHDWKLEAARPELDRIMKDPQLVSLREAVFPALLALSADKAALEDTLVSVADTDPNMQASAVFQRAVVELGNLKSKKAVPSLLRLAYFRNNKNEEVFQAVRRALAAIDDPTILQGLLDIAAGKNEDVKKYARSMNVPEWELTAGVKTVQLIMDRLDAAGLPALMSSFEIDLSPPQGLSDRAFDAWRMGQMNRLKVVMFAMGHFGDDAIVPRLATLVKTTTNDTVNQRINGATALAMIGSEAAQDALIDAFVNDPQEIFKAPLLQVVALGIDDRRLEAFDAMLGKLRPGAKKPRKPIELSPEVTEALNTNERLQNYVGVVRECGDNMGCYITKLKSEKQDEQVKALAVLGRGRFGDGDAVRDAIFQAFRDADVKLTDNRRFAALGMTRVGKAVDGEKMLTISEGLPKGDLYWKEELFALGQAMTRRK